MKRFYLFFIGLTLFGGDIDFNISLNKESFLEREPIWVRCIVTNKGSSAQKILSFKSGALEGVSFFLIPEDLNNIIQPIRIFISYSTEPLILIGAGDSIIVYENLLRKLESVNSPQQKTIEFFNKRGIIGKGVAEPVKPRLHPLLIGYLKPGRYKLYACYSTRWDEKDGREDIYSDTLEFEVIPPFGKEKEALKLLEKSNYKEVFEKYPQSVYAPISLYHHYLYQRILSRHKKQIEENVNELLMTLLEKYPDSPAIKYIDLQMFLQSYSDRGKLKEGRSRLKSVLEKDPNSYAAKMIREILKSTENKSTYTTEDIIKDNK